LSGVLLLLLILAIVVILSLTSKDRILE
jgi:hypothetical protein